MDGVRTRVFKAESERKYRINELKNKLLTLKNIITMKKIYIITFMLALSCVAFGQQATNNSDPQFDGEESNEKSREKINKYIYSQIRTTVFEEAMKNSITGSVIVQFHIDVDGSVVDAKIFLGAHPLLDAEALRIFNSMPKWTPAYNRGKPVKTMMIWPVHFYFKKDDDKGQ